MAETSKPSQACRVAITTSNGSKFTGIQHAIDYASGKIVLKSVVTDGVKLYGPQNFFASDILELVYLDECDMPGNFSSKTKPTVLSKKDQRHMYGKKLVHKHLATLNTLDTDELLPSNIFNDDPNCDQGIGSGEDGQVDEFEDYYVTDEYTYICRVCEKFQDAIRYIMNQPVVGVTFEGVELGRNGTLSLIQVATKDEVIVFDVLRLGEEAFIEGLHDFFVSKHVMKVVHDCRWISDLMQQQYDIDLTNIFDTQVANAFVYRIRNNGDWPRHVESLPGCLVSNLNLPQDHVHFMKVRERAREKDQQFWLQRPLPDGLLSASTKNVRFLIELHNVMLSKMLLEFKAGVEIFLNHVRNMEGNIDKCRSEMHLLPFMFNDIHKYVAYALPQEYLTRFVTTDQRGFRDNVLDIHDKRIIYSHDSVWHKSKESELKSSTRPESKRYTEDSGQPEEPNGRRDQSYGRRGQAYGKRDQTNCYTNGRNVRTAESSNQSSALLKDAISKQNNLGLGNKTSTSGSAGNNSQRNNSRKQQNRSANVTNSRRNEDSGVNDNRFTGLSNANMKANPNNRNNSNPNHPYIQGSSGCADPSSRNNKNGAYPSSLSNNSGAKSNGQSGAVTSSIRNQDSSSISQSTNSAGSPPFSNVNAQHMGNRIEDPNVGTEKQMDSQSAAEPKPVTPISPENVSDSIRSSKIWQALYNKGGSSSQSPPESLPLSDTSKVKSDDIEAATMGHTLSEEERADRALAQLENLQFKRPAKKSGSLNTRNVNLQLSQNVTGRTEVDPANSTSESVSSSSTSASDTDSAPFRCVPTESDLRREKDLDMAAFIPAGLHSRAIGRKKARRMQESGKRLNGSDFDESGKPAAAATNNAEDEPDFGCIPMQQSLQRKSDLPLGISAIGIGDPFTDDESGMLGSKPQSFKSGSQNGFKGSDMDENSEKFQRVLKLASAVSSKKKIEKKLLPAKSISPSAGHVTK